jgi:hypothetical protein
MLTNDSATKAIQVQVLKRYKDADRLAWEKDYDCIRQMKLWMIAIAASSEEIAEIDSNKKRSLVKTWRALSTIIGTKELVTLLERVAIQK